jgi:hypothetical protein
VTPLLTEDQYRQWRELEARCANAPMVPAQQISVGERFRTKTGAYTRVSPSWDDTQHIFGVMGLKVIKVKVEEQVQTIPAGLCFTYDA